MGGYQVTLPRRASAGLTVRGAWHSSFIVSRIRIVETHLAGFSLISFSPKFKFCMWRTIRQRLDYSRGEVESTRQPDASEGTTSIREN